MTTPRAGVLMWDYRQGPDLDELRDLVRDLSDGRLHVHHVDADLDEVVIVLSTAALDDEQVKTTWERWWLSGDARDTGIAFPLDQREVHRDQ